MATTQFIGTINPVTKEWAQDVNDLVYEGAAATGGTAVRTLADHFGDTLSLSDFYSASDPDWTNAFTRAAASGKPVKMPYGNLTISSPVTFSANLYGAGCDDGQTTIVLTGSGQLIPGDDYLHWDGFTVTSSVNSKTFIKNNIARYWRFTNFRLIPSGGATGQVGVEFSTSATSIYFCNLDNFEITVGYPVKVSGNSTGAFNANKIGSSVGGNKWYNFASAITVEAGVLAFDANEIGGYFETGVNIFTFSGSACRQNRFKLINDAVTRIWNSSVTVNDMNCWEILDANGFTYAGTRPQNQYFIGQQSSKVRAANSVATVMATATEVTMVFDDEQYDTLSEFVHTTGIFTPKYAGYYQFDAQALSAAYTWPVGTRFEARLYKNGTPIAVSDWNASETASAASIQRSARVSSFFYMNGTTDTASIRLYHNRGANTSLDTAPTSNYINIIRLPM